MLRLCWIAMLHALLWLWGGTGPGSNSIPSSIFYATLYMILKQITEIMALR